MNNTYNIKDLGSFISKLQEMDKNKGKVISRAKRIYLVIAVVYILAFIAHVIKGAPISEMLIYLCYVLGFSIIYYLLKVKGALFQVNYAEPLITLLIKAKKRHSFFSISFWGVLLVVLMLNIPITHSFNTDPLLLRIDIPHRIFVIQVIYFAIVAIAILIAYFVKKSKKKELMTSIDSMLNELGG
jgi:hypothetical protein